MMGRSSKMSQLPYDAARLLAELRREKGFSSFGLLIQALFAHVILRLGGDILDIRSPGHPDIRAIFGGRIHNIEVETAKRKTNPRRLESWRSRGPINHQGLGARLLLCFGLRAASRMVVRGYCFSRTKDH